MITAFLTIILVIFNSFCLSFIFSLVIDTAKLFGYRKLLPDMINQHLLLTSAIIIIMICYILSRGMYAKIIAKLSGCRKLIEVESDYLLPILDDVQRNISKYRKYRKLNNIKLYIIDDNNINAFAIGKSIIALTKGALQRCDEQQLKAVIAHEFCHLYDNSAQYMLILNGLGKVAAFLFSTFTILYTVTSIVSRSIKITFLFLLMPLLVFYLMTFLLKFSNYLINIIIKISQRGREYDADYFACSVGYMRGAVSFLDLLYNADTTPPKGINALVFATHPSPAYRLEAVKNYNNNKVKKRRIKRHDITLFYVFSAIIFISVIGYNYARENNISITGYLKNAVHIAKKPLLFESGKFPKGEFITASNAEEFIDKYFIDKPAYYSGKIVLDRKIGEHEYIGREHREKGWLITRLFEPDELSFVIKIPYYIPYQKGMGISFPKSSPLHVTGVFNDNDMNKIYCVYYGYTEMNNRKYPSLKI